MSLVADALRERARRAPRDLAAILRPRALALYALGIVATVALVETDADWRWFVALRNTPAYFALVPAVGVLGLVIVGALVALLVVALRRRDAARVALAFALGEAALLGVALSSAIKLFTGRQQPPRRLVGGALDVSHGFRFGFDRGGAFWGWPSSHATVAFATAVALVGLTPGRRGLHVAALAFAAYIALGVSVSIHWLSDAVAGACLGTAIGLAVSRRPTQGL